MITVTANGKTRKFNPHNIYKLGVAYVTNQQTKKIVPVLVIGMKNRTVIVCPFENEPKDGEDLFYIKFDPEIDKE